ncbi:hypothetical protein SGRA_2651 [Saprospira grandis str. Lewin]|uniref:Lipoprotein n=1 Tax=Saprospira grandis (strain Lewin) TaxID=984262 RepID=H6L851_SAPGL|nr:hypothetical protein SGRA_2651 [Saprospira grandis str. Lewin]
MSQRPFLLAFFVFSGCIFYKNYFVFLHLAGGEAAAG